MNNSSSSSNVYSPSSTPAWKHLEALAAASETTRISDYFNADPQRTEKYSATCNELLLDFSKNLISDTAWATLLELLEQSPFLKHRQAMFEGEKINTTEDRAVLHTALRAEEGDAIGTDITQVKAQLKKVAQVSEKIRTGHWLGSTGKPVTDIINLGIGGSDLGPKLACKALDEFAHPHLTMHFISNVDGAEILSLLAKLNPETTLCIIASKTFTTQETLLNAKTTLSWFEEKLALENAQSSQHFIAVTANRQNALDYGIPNHQILDFAEWVGGRYSLWSSIGLPIAISIGFENFCDMLTGAREMDQHFLTAPAEKNIPVILALVGIWYRNFLNTPSIATIPYCERLSLLPSYLQQLDMESNGKSVTLSGSEVNVGTGPILWGQPGTNGQHAFFQLLHQGAHLVPIDFIATINDPLSNAEHHKILLSNMLAQASALMQGQPAPEGQPHRYYPGNKPSNILLMKELSPRNFGALIALYEHKIFVQGSIWGINSFDQWGVELGKKIAGKLLDTHSEDQFDPSTERLRDFIGKNTD